MTIARRKLSDANLEIMNLVWEKGEATINDVFEALNVSRKKKLKRATVQVQMRRLERYGWLKHRLADREFVYFPVRNEGEAKKGILDNVRRRVFGGSHAELIRCLFENSRIPEEEIRRILELLRKREGGGT
jgi:predicted transcriptional regulator